MADRRLTVIQMLPALESGGVERGTLEVGSELVRQGHRSIVISAGGGMVEALEAGGSEHVNWDVGTKRLKTLRWVSRVEALLKEVRPDILHLRSRLPAWIGYLAWRRIPPSARPHLVTTVHGPYTVNRYSAVMVRGERVIAVSETIRDYILRNYPFVDPDVIRVVHRGVNRSVFPYGYRPSEAWLEAWRHNCPRLEGKYVVMLPGRLTRWKGQEHFTEIIAALKRHGVPVHGLLAGGAHPKKDHFLRALRESVERSGLSQDITFLGHRSDLREVMAVSDAVLSLSLEPEAFGRTTIEALSIGKPVAGYAHGGVEEQLDAVFPAGRVDVGDVDKIVELLMQWYTDPPVVRREHRFTLDQMLHDTLLTYNELAQISS